MNPPPKFTVRIRYRVAGKVRFVSHRDTARIMERAFRRIGLPVAYSEGFSPRPKLSFGLALSVAYESEAEYLDVDLVTPVEIADLAVRLSDVLPDGISVTAVGWLEKGSISLQQAIVCCRWEIEVVKKAERDSVVDSVDRRVVDSVDRRVVDSVDRRVREILDSTEVLLERERKGKTTVTDIRPSILDVEVMGPTDHGVQLVAILATQPVALRPSEFVRVLSLEHGEGRVRRINQFTIRDGKRFEPLEAPALSTHLQSAPEHNEMVSN